MKILVLFIALFAVEAGIAGNLCSSVFNQESIKFSWPNSGEPASIDSLTEVMRDDFRLLFQFERKDEEKDIEWKGPSVPKFARVTSYPYRTQLSASNLKYSIEEQGRDALKEILVILAQIGMEQGRRVLLQSKSFDLILNLLASARDAVKENKLELGVKFSEDALLAIEHLREVPLSSFEERQSFEKKSDQTIDWPSSGKPVRETELVSQISNTLQQAYTIKTKNDERLDKALESRLLQALELSVEQGKRFLVKNDTDYERILFSVKRLSIQADLIKHGKKYRDEYIDDINVIINDAVKLKHDSIYK